MNGIDMYKPSIHIMVVYDIVFLTLYGFVHPCQTEWG